MNTREIGNQILRDFCRGEFQLLDDGRIEFRVDGLTVRCRRSIDEVNAVIDKFRRGLPRGGRTAQSVKPTRPRCKGRFKPSAEAFFAFVEDGERDNALEYIRQWPREDWPRAVASWLFSEEKRA